MWVGGLGLGVSLNKYCLIIISVCRGCPWCNCSENIRHKESISTMEAGKISNCDCNNASFRLHLFSLQWKTWLITSVTQNTSYWYWVLLTLANAIKNCFPVQRHLHRTEQSSCCLFVNLFSFTVTHLSNKVQVPTAGVVAPHLVSMESPKPFIHKSCRRPGSQGAVNTNC